MEESKGCFSAIFMRVHSTQEQTIPYWHTGLAVAYTFIRVALQREAIKKTVPVTRNGFSFHALDFLR